MLVNWGGLLHGVSGRDRVAVFVGKGEGEQGGKWGGKGSIGRMERGRLGEARLGD